MVRWKFSLECVDASSFDCCSYHTAIYWDSAFRLDDLSCQLDKSSKFVFGFVLLCHLCWHWSMEVRDRCTWLHGPVEHLAWDCLTRGQDVTQRLGGVQGSSILRPEAEHRLHVVASQDTLRLWSVIGTLSFSLLSSARWGRGQQGGDQWLLCRLGLGHAGQGWTILIQWQCHVYLSSPLHHPWPPVVLMTVWHQTIFKVILQLSECSVPFPRFNVYFSNERGFSLLVPMIKAGAGLGIDSHIADVHLANVHQALYSTFTISLILFSSPGLWIST